MKYRKLLIDNFGPYYGEQSIDFPKESGVWVIYGDNGRGKTTLLNAFRYALHGKVLDRRGERALVECANRRAAAESGTSAFRVVLDVEHNDNEYRITRSYRDGEQTVIVERDGVPLRDSEARSVLLSIAPESISQFFLFDGELLRQYEDLREPGADSGQRMRQEVDRILGVQALERAIADVREVGAEAAKEKAKALAAQDKAANLAVAMQEAAAKRDALSTALSDLNTTEMAHKRRLAELEEELSKHERARGVLVRIDVLKERRTKLSLDLHDLRDAYRASAGDMWKAVLQPAIVSQLPALDGDLAKADQRRVEAHVAQAHARHIERNQECPVCNTVLSESKRTEILGRASQAGSAKDVEDLDALVESLRRRRSLLELLQDSAPGATLAERDKAIRTCQLEIEENRSDIATQERSLAGISEGDLRRTQHERDSIHHLLSRDRDDIQRTEADIVEQDTAIGGFRKALRDANVTADPVLELRDDVTSDLLQLFIQALDQYQRELVGRVEIDASEVFAKIRSESGYARLRIRDGYALSIVDGAGKEVIGHSAGYEHLVALSLIAALQKSSPVRGPVVMDSPFGRLDHGHTRNAVAALPQIAGQVVLLAFDGEFDRSAAFKDLGSQLVGEFSLVRTGTDETEIRRREPS